MGSVAVARASLFVTYSLCSLLMLREVLSCLQQLLLGGLLLCS